MLIVNGKPNDIQKIKLKDRINFDQVKKTIMEALDYKSYKKIRIFKQGGVELYEEDVEFIHNNEMLYISKGEDFD